MIILHIGVTRIILIFILIIVISGNVYAFGIDDLTGTSVSDTTLTDAGNSIITIVTTTASVISVIMLIVLGLKYMLGSVEEKAEYKKSLKPYLIGAVLAFAASTIAGIIYNIATHI